MLFDIGATYLFISHKFATILNRSHELLKSPLTVLTLVGKSIRATQILRTCPMNLEDELVFANLVLLDIVDYHVILGME